jgi:hypothetical protein
MKLVPAKSFLIAAALAWSGIVAAMLTVSREPAPAQPVPPSPAQFDERWDEPLPLKKQDRLPLPVLPVPGPVPAQTAEPIVLAQPQAQVEAKPAAPKQKSMREGVCAKGKRWFKKRNGRKYWRCRR